MTVIRIEASRRDVVPVPRLGAACFCCNEATNGRSQRIVPKGYGFGRTYYMPGGMSVPVCADCQHHAIRRQPVMAVIGSVIGVFTFAVAIAVGGPHRVLELAAGIVLFVLGMVWTVIGTSNEREARSRARHHPSLTIQIGPRWTQVWTKNPQLVDRLRRLNPTATVRGERRATVAPQPTEEATAQLVQRVLDHELADAYALLRTGAVDVLEAERRLAELDAVIGGATLRQRLRDVREGRAA